MEIFASSAQVISDFFLHAGYSSVSSPTPHSISPEAIKEIFTGYEPVLKLDMAEALRLKGEAIGGGVSDASMPLLSNITALIDGERIVVILGIVFFIAGLSLIYRYKKDVTPKRFASLLSLLALMLIGFAGAVGGFGTLHHSFVSDKPPWKGITPKAYEHPEDATKAILYGIIADANFDIFRRINTLADLKDEVGLPSRDLTEGQRYALANYGLDGWGHPFRLEKVPSRYIMTKSDDAPVTVSTSELYEYQNKGYSLETGTVAHYSIRSDGADGIPNTADDITAAIMPFNGNHWEYYRWGYFIKHTGKDRLLFVHRCVAQEYQTAHGWLASRLTGSLLFDVEQIPRDVLSLTPATHDSHTSASTLWLVVFKQPNGQKKVPKS